MAHSRDARLLFGPVTADARDADLSRLTTVSGSMQNPASRGPRPKIKYPLRCDYECLNLRRLEGASVGCSS